MKQIIQNYKSGKILLEEISMPLLVRSGAIVQNYYSLISSGTEGMKIKTGQKSLMGKAKSRPDLVHKVLNTIKKEGLISTTKSVLRKLDKYSALGYSSCGKVIEISDDIEGISVGDYVACGGAGFANHAEYVYIPKNLLCKIPEGVKLIEASFTTVGAIAVQGVRLLNYQFGSRVLVIGLGLIGQITVQILNASGIYVFGIDIKEDKINFAKNYGLREGSLIDSSDLEQKIKSFTANKGFDGVIITASTKSNKPIEIAGKYCREKGRVVVVGEVNMDIPRDDYYKKEIELVVSKSYGPGRYDNNYEVKGLDYPISYVRWTENRNMQSFLELVASKRINIKPLISKIYSLENYQDAYNDAIDNKQDNFGIVFKYDVYKEIKSGKIKIKDRKVKLGKINASFIGAGSYAQKFLIPLFAKNKDVNLYSIYSSTGLSAKNVGKKYKFNYVNNNLGDIFSDKNNNLVVISTRHDSHFEMVIRALENNKNVFVEKPLCIKEEQLELIKETYNNSKSTLMVGFNRRFAVFTKKVKEIYNDRNYPLIINYRINAGEIDKDHWIQDAEIGGGRIIGELCHFINFIYYLIRNEPTSIYAAGFNDREIRLVDTLTTGINFKDGSIANISYISKGSNLLFKEYIEIFGGGISVAIKDFKECTIYSSNLVKLKLINQDKGQNNEIKEFIASLLEKGKSPISFEEIYKTTLLTFKVIESIKRNKVVFLN